MKVMITGNDKRSLVIKNVLKTKTDFEVYEYDGTVTEDTRVIILPTPVTNDSVNLNFTAAQDKSIASLLKNSPANCVIIGAGYKNSRVYDLCDRDDFSIDNAVPTAEGAIAIAINNTEKTLYDSNILVTGFGRVSRILLDRLKAFKANITVAARKSGNLAEIKALGISAVKITDISTVISDFDIVINTVPYCIFDKETLSHANRDTLFIELASLQTGFDKDTANKLPHYVNAPGIPGKTSPISAGEIMAKTILTVLSENNIY